MQLENFDGATFLRDHWQRRPLLLRGAWTGWQNPIEPDALAGLACEDGVESRLITQPRATWRVEQGPLPEARFGKLGTAPWTLLVQAVDQHVPDVAALLRWFRFIPNWRIDDVMVSYATDGGGVGPHFDQYDVFLIQGLGRRRWQVGAQCDADTVLLPHDDLRLLADFTPTDEWVLEPGDMLYVPPRFAHDGVAVGDECMTYSIGFRAPSRSELIAHYCDDLLAGLDDDDRYADAALGLQANPGEIAPSALAALHAMVVGSLADTDAFARWFGGFITTPKSADMEWQSDEPQASDDVGALIAKGAVIRRNPASRFAYVEHDHGVALFVDGTEMACAGDVADLARQLCDAPAIEPPTALPVGGAALIAELLDRGSIALDPAG